jgi:hypothetical protein
MPEKLEQTVRWKFRIRHGVLIPPNDNQSSLFKAISGSPFQGQTINKK